MSTVSGVKPQSPQPQDAAAANEATVRAFFAAYSAGDAAKMSSMLSPNSTYRDPSFGSLSGADVPAMWGIVAGGSTKVSAEIQDVTLSNDGRTAQASVVESYKFFGNPIQNHLTTTFQFGADGKIVSQQDAFSWSAWGKQTGDLSPLLETPLGHLAVRLYLRYQLAHAEMSQKEAAASVDLSGFSKEVQAALRAVLDKIGAGQSWLP
jgi:ketosteroid isomerase-like protein